MFFHKENKSENLLSINQDSYIIKLHKSHGILGVHFLSDLNVFP